MSDTMIKVEGLGKKYQIHHESKAPYQTIREALGRKMLAFGRPSAADSSTEDFWAL